MGFAIAVLIEWNLKYFYHCHTYIERRYFGIIQHQLLAFCIYLTFCYYIIDMAISYVI